MNVKTLLTKTIGTALLAGALVLAPQAAQARVFVSVAIAPPAIPVYTQPLCPGDGYIWTPGYWAYTDDGYQWVDGAWVLAPYTGALWTPGYWGYNDGLYVWNAGYWGPVVGYYGGINYGFGYFGVGFYGGYWNHGAFFYNREYNHFGGGFRGDHFYSQHVGNYDGRPGGTSFATGHFDGNRGASSNSAANNATNRGGFGQNGFQNGARSTMQSANVYREADNTNRGSSFNRSGVSTGGFNQNAGRSTMVSAAPYAGNFNRGSVQPASNSYQASAGRPSGGSSFHAPSAASGGGFHASSGGGGSHGGRR